MLKVFGCDSSGSSEKIHACRLLEVESPANETLAANSLRTASVEAQGSLDWALPHIAATDQYNAWASQRQPYSQRVRRWREECE